MFNTMSSLSKILICVTGILATATIGTAIKDKKANNNADEEYVDETETEPEQ